MELYKHKVNYYETDRMGITHHSNYIRFMEEARIDFLSQIGWDYARLEEMGIISPVTAVECKYKNTTTFSDVLTIKVGVEEFKGVKLKIKYEMVKEDGSLAFEGHSEHCFLDKDGKPVRMKKEYPELYDVMTELVGK